MHRGIAAAERTAAEHALALLGELGLEAAAAMPAGGQQKLLELARALMAAPRLLLLDEPCAGVNPAGIEILSAAIARCRDDVRDRRAQR